MAVNDFSPQPFPIADSPYDGLYLSLHGFNYPTKPIRLRSGSLSEPSVCCADDNRMGFYFPEEGKITFCWYRDLVSVSSSGLALHDSLGRSVTLSPPPNILSNKTLSLPNTSGTLCASESLICEELIGTKDGVNTSFTVTHPVKKALWLARDGLVAIDHVTYTEGSDAITWVSSPIPTALESLLLMYVRDF